MDEVRSGRIPFCKLDVLHRRNLERILPRFDVSGLAEDVMHHLNLAWHRLDAWPDVPPGLTRLKKRFMLAPCSNGNISLMVDIARRNNLRGTRSSAPRSRATTSRSRASISPPARAFDLPPGECMMVAAHSRDLGEAAKLGLRTAHISRLNEHGPGKGEAAPKVPVDYAARAWKIWPASSRLKTGRARRDALPAATVRPGKQTGTSPA